MTERARARYAAGWRRWRGRGQRMAGMVTRLALLGALAMSAVHAADIGPKEARRLRAAGEILPLDAILQQALALQPGQVLDSELDREDDRYVYELEILDSSGVVHELEMDAATGELRAREVDD